MQTATHTNIQAIRVATAMPQFNEQTYTINQFIATFKVGRTATYQEIGSGRITTYKVGRRRYISARAAAEWLNRLEEEATNLAAQTTGAI
ncbi:MAG: hypothetical protein Q7K57_59250 [Burkholderiaceae bacterium]|nr:hypothetical protein [Burkholderiaceae bacterium]